MFTTGQGVVYSSHRTDTNVVVLVLAWGAFIFAGLIAMYYLGHALWGKATAGEGCRPAGAPRPGGQPPEPGSGEGSRFARWRDGPEQVPQGA